MATAHSCNTRSQPLCSPKRLQMETPLRLQYTYMPFIRLPRELQAEVFLRCLPVDNLPSLNGCDPPLLLLLVCRAWRDLALSTPRLWNSFQVNFLDYAEQDAYRLLSTAASWLARSADVPLSVSLTDLSRSSVAHSSAMAMLAILLRHSARWDRMELRLPGKVLTPLLSTAPHQFERLRSFTLDLQGHWCAPNFAINSLGIKWEQLSELSLILEQESILTLDECWDLLSLTTNLQKCALNARSIFHQSHYSSELVLALETFQLTLQGEADEPAAALVGFLESLELPLLADLRLSWLIQDNATGFESSLCSVFQQLNPSMDTLQLSYLPVTEDQLVQMLQCVPYVTQLILQFSLGSTLEQPVTATFFDALTSILPHLKSLRIDCSGVAWSANMLERNLSLRIQQGLQFDAFISNRDEQIRDLCDRWRAEGLGVEMHLLHFR